MPATFLTSVERDNYERTPKIEQADIPTQYHLTDTDIIFIKGFYGRINQIAVAIQVCSIRLFGFLCDNWISETTSDIVLHVSSRLGHGVPEAPSLLGYGARQPTRSFHQQQVLQHLGFKKWQPMDNLFIEEWLLQQGMEHDNERFLLEMLCQKLHRDKILRPSIGALERIVGGIGDKLDKETYHRLSALWNEGLLKKLDALLEIDDGLKLTPHRWLCQAPTSNTPKAMNETLNKVVFVKAIGVGDWDLPSVPKNRRKRLANIVRNNTNTYLKRFKPSRLYPMLLCFLSETLLDTTDCALEIYNIYWQQMIGEAKKMLEDYQLESIRLQDRAVMTLSKTVEMVMDETIDPVRLREAIFNKLPKQDLLEALALVLKTSKPLKQGHLFFLLKQYQKISSVGARLLSVLEFSPAFLKDNFKAGLALVIALQNGTKRKLPADVPANFITPSWKKLIFDETGIQAKAYELCVLSVLRDRLMSGDIYVDRSRKFADFNSFLIPKELWQKEADKICGRFDGIDILGRIDEMAVELGTLLPVLSGLLEKGTEIRLEDGILVVPPIDGEDLPASAKLLQGQINQRLPQVGIAEMIREVDSWVGYSKELAENAGQASSSHPSIRYAALMANGCNLSLADIARSSELDYNALWWVANNYLTDDNLKKANDILVNFHHRQWIASYWGNGTLSSSDGQRFPTSGKIRNARSLPRYFGYGKGVTFYTHTSDQYSQYGTKVISATERDATYVLDEILSNETDLEILEHTTDTHGYTDLIFALFDLVGKQFAPRIRDIKDLTLCKIKASDENANNLQYPPLKFTGTVNMDYLKKHVDGLKHVAASLRTGTVMASLLINKLQAYPRQNNLMYVLQAYGQLRKTIFICKYLSELPLRHKINAQLNKGEQLHNLRLYLWFGGDGIIRKKQETQQQVTARCLNVLSNISMVWSTVYTESVIEQLRMEGISPSEEDIKRISPAPFEHINRLGKYEFNSEIKLAENGLRKLRNPNNPSQTV